MAQDYFAILVQPTLQATAEAGTNNNEPMTPLRSKQQVMALGSRQNAKHYTSDTIDDGTTDARAAILAADAVGPVVLPPGTYAITSNMTLTNTPLLEPGAKIKPASGVYIFCDKQVQAGAHQIFDLSAGGFVGLNPAYQDEVKPEWWGAVPMREPREIAIGGSYNTIDSTQAFRDMFASFVGATAYGGESATPATRLAALRFPLQVKLSGWYAVTDEIWIHDIWLNMQGVSPKYNGTGFRWCGVAATDGSDKYYGPLTDSTSFSTFSQSAYTVTATGTGQFTQQDIGKKIKWISGAGSGSIATITAFTSANVVTVDVSQTVAAGNIKYFREAAQTSILNLTGCDNSVIANVGFMGNYTVEDNERPLAAIRFSNVSGYSVQRRCQLENIIICDPTGEFVDLRQGYGFHRGILEGGQGSFNGNNDFFILSNININRVNHGIRIEYDQAVEWTINNYGFGYGDVMFSSHRGTIINGDGWYCYSDVYEGLIKLTGTGALQLKLSGVSSEHLKGHYWAHNAVAGGSIIGTTAGTFCPPSIFCQYRNIQVVSGVASVIDTGSGAAFYPIDNRQFFSDYHEDAADFKLIWATGTDAGASCEIATVTNPYTATVDTVTGSAVANNIALGRAILVRKSDLREFRLFDGETTSVSELLFKDMRFSPSNTIQWAGSGEYEAPDGFRTVIYVGQANGVRKFSFTFLNCLDLFENLYLYEDGDASHNLIVDFNFVGCTPTYQADVNPYSFSRRYTSETLDAYNMVDLSTWATDSTTHVGANTLIVGDFVGGSGHGINTQTHRVPSSAFHRVVVSGFFKTNRKYLGLGALTDANANKWGTAFYVVTKFGTPTDPDLFGKSSMYLSEAVHKFEGMTTDVPPFSANTDLVLSIYVDTTLLGDSYKLSQTLTTVTGTSGVFAAGDVGKLITWTSGADIGATARIVSVTAANEVEVDVSQTVGLGHVEFERNGAEGGYLALQPMWIELMQEPQYLVNYFGAIAAEATGENLLEKTEEASNAYWSSNTNATFSLDAEANPYGRTTADKVIADATNGVHCVQRTMTGLTASEMYTTSVRVKADGYTHLAIYSLDGSAGKFFNLSNGTVGSDFFSAPYGSGIVDLGSGWYLCWIADASGGSNYVGFYVCSADGTYSFAGNATGGILFGGMQLNQGFGPAPYKRVE